MVLLHKILFAIKRSKDELEHPKASQSILNNPKYGCFNSNFNRCKPMRFLQHKIIFAIKWLKVELEHPRASKNILKDPKFVCFNSNFNHCMAKRILLSKNNFPLFLLRKILFAIKQSKFELEHPNLESVRLLSGALGDSCSTFDCFMSKYIL